MKKIKVFSTLRSGIIELTVNANTWGELKAELSKEGITTSEMDATVKEGQISLVQDGAELPEGKGKDNQGNVTHDFTLYLAPSKTKSGR